MVGDCIGRRPFENMESSDTDSSSDDDKIATTKLIQQLQILQSLVPNIKQMDEISILEETRNYLQRIKEETEQIEKELSQRSEDPISSAKFDGESSTQSRVLGVETEKATERTFVIKMSWKEGKGRDGGFDNDLFSSPQKESGFVDKHNLRSSEEKKSA
ncbi:uncharacterized protein LOC143846984 isoform X2 [Tasmannia lanceolata]|uniref:uncharacterized protein LOC143846984 isoform X2 n=1 Tax=Tasmannia lanceolata TaxID=3420 RepID=UPI004062D90A